jgi:hypothetical protein
MSKEKQLKLKQGRMVENESLFIRRIFFANKVLLGFNDDDNFQLGTDLLTIKDVFHDTNSRLNLFKEGEDDTNQVMSEFSFKIVANQF